MAQLRQWSFRVVGEWDAYPFITANDVESRLRDLFGPHVRLDAVVIRDEGIVDDGEQPE